jgi:hypothetical protein
MQPDGLPRREPAEISECGRSRLDDALSNNPGGAGIPIFAHASKKRAYVMMPPSARMRKTT